VKLDTFTIIVLMFRGGYWSWIHC